MLLQKRDVGRQKSVVRRGEERTEHWRRARVQTRGLGYIVRFDAAKSTRKLAGTRVSLGRWRQTLRKVYDSLQHIYVFRLPYWNGSHRALTRSQCSSFVFLIV